MLSKREVGAYLSRIGYEGDLAPTKENLAGLMLCHLASIPYETVGLHRTGVVPDLSLDALYHKIVTERLGGYCFEQNKLFQALLEALGYQARPCLARSTDTPGQDDPFNHRGLLVRLDGQEHLADVGWGGPMAAGPLAMADVGLQTVDGKGYLVTCCDGAWWQVDRLSSSRCAPDGSPQRLGVMHAYMAEVRDQDFQALNLMCAQPGSEFRDVEMANLRTPGGYVALTDRRLTVREGEEKRVADLSPSEVDDVLWERFGLDYRRRAPAACS